MSLGKKETKAFFRMAGSDARWKSVNNESFLSPRRLKNTEVLSDGLELALELVLVSGNSSEVQSQE